MKENTNIKASLVDFIGRHQVMLFIVAPVLVVFGYYFLIAEPSYQSEAKIIVRNNNDKSIVSIPGISPGVLGGEASSAIKDSYILIDYFVSGQLIEQLDREFNLRAHYSRPALDRLRRLDASASVERFYRYFGDKVRAKVTLDSGIITFSVEAFEPEMALQLTRRIIEISESTINVMNDRVLASTMNLAERELKESRQDLAAIRKRMLDFQLNRKILSPQNQMEVWLSHLATLDARILAKKTELRMKEQFLKKDAFELKSLRQELTGLESQREMESGSLFDSNGTGMASASYEYEAMKLEAEFALHTYTAALSAHEQAKLEALRQEKFLLTVSAPYLPEEFSYPDPVRGTFIAFIILSLVYGIGRLVVATIYDHTV